MLVSIVSTCSGTSFLWRGKWLIQAKVRSIKLLDALELINVNSVQLTLGVAGNWKGRAWLGLSNINEE